MHSSTLDLRSTANLPYMRPKGPASEALYSSWSPLPCAPVMAAWLKIIHGASGKKGVTVTGLPTVSEGATVKSWAFS